MQYVRGWWSDSNPAKLEAAQKALLCLCATSTTSHKIDIGGGEMIHHLEVQKATKINAMEETIPPLVLMPGYGMGAACWYRTFPFFAEHFHVYAGDWLGCGMSSRPVFRCRNAKVGYIWNAETLQPYNLTTLQQYSSHPSTLISLTS